MAEIKANLIIDLGNSETRIVVQSGTNSKGLVGQRVRSFSNRFARMNVGYVLPEDYQDDPSTVLFLHNNTLYANGTLVDKEFSTSALRPTATGKKHEQEEIVLAIIRSFYEGYQLLAGMYQQRVEDLDVIWNVSYLLPPMQVNLGGKPIHDKIKAIEKIEFIKDSLTKEIKTNTVQALSEGVAAYVGVMFDRGRVPRPDYAYLGSSTTLLMDIGAGTTDILVINGGVVNEETKTTVNYGGNNVASLISRSFSSQGIELPMPVITQAVLEGKVTIGVKEYAIVEQITSAKQRVSEAIVTAIKQSFEASLFPMATINNVLVCGGGALESGIDGDKPLSAYIVSELNKFLPEVHHVKLPSNVDPRQLNVLGAAILAPAL